MAEQTDKNDKQDEILIPAIPNVECRDGKEIGIWMEGWLQGHKKAQEKVNEIHKKRIKDAYERGQNTGWSYGNGVPSVKLITGEDYYEQTFNKESNS